VADQLWIKTRKCRLKIFSIDKKKHGINLKKEQQLELLFSIIYLIVDTYYKHKANFLQFEQNEICEKSGTVYFWERAGSSFFLYNLSYFSRVNVNFPWHQCAVGGLSSGRVYHDHPNLKTFSENQPSTPRCVDFAHPTF